MSELDPVFGRPEARAWHGYQAKGNLLAARPRYVLERWGQAALRDVASRLDPATREMFEAPWMPFAWSTFPVMAAIDRAIVQGPMGNDVSQMLPFGATIARYDLPTLYKVLFKIGTPAFILKRIGVVYSTYLRGGTMVVEESSAKSTRLALMGELPLYFCRYGMSGWLTAAVELSGGRDVAVDHPECVHLGAPRCSWRVTWT